MAGPFNLLQGGLGAVGWLPVYLDNGKDKPLFWGFTSVLIRFPQVLQDVGLEELTTHGLSYELSRMQPENGKKQVIAASADDLFDPVTRSFDLPNGVWTLSVAPTKGWADPFGLQFKASGRSGSTVCHEECLVAEVKGTDKGDHALILAYTGRDACASGLMSWVQGRASSHATTTLEYPLKMSSNADFQPLKCSMLTPGTGFSRPYFYTPNPVKINASAMEVMTDLRFVPAATSRTDILVVAARQKMIARGVRLLLVVDDNGDILGLITARDLDGSRIEQAMSGTSLGFNELKVADVMTSGIEVLPLEAVLYARVGDIVATLKHSGRQHALVADEDPFTQKPMVRGVFSASQIARQLGIVTGQNDLSETFAHIDQAINQGLASD